MGVSLTRTQIKNLERLGEVNPLRPTVFPPAVGKLRSAFIRSLREEPSPRRSFCFAIIGEWKGVKPPPPVRLKDYSIKLPVSQPNMVIVRSSPVLPDQHTSKDDEVEGPRREQAFKMVKAAMDAMGEE